LRYRFTEEVDCVLTIEDAFGQFGDGHAYRLELRTDEAPFELTIPRQGDKKKPLQDQFLATPGGQFVVPVQCKRHQFDDAIALRVESDDVACVPKNAEVEAKQGNVNLRVRLRESPAVGELVSFRVSGVATVGDHQYQESLRTREVLAERNSGVSVPDAIDGLLAVRVIESPLRMEISPPDEITAGGDARNVPVKLVWKDEKRKFNTTLRIVGVPQGVKTSEKKLNAKDTTTGLELKLDKGFEGQLDGLRVEITLDYYKQPLLVQSKPFTIPILKPDDKSK